MCANTYGFPSACEVYEIAARGLAGCDKGQYHELGAVAVKEQNKVMRVPPGVFEEPESEKEDEVGGGAEDSAPDGASVQPAGPVQHDAVVQVAGSGPAVRSVSDAISPASGGAAEVEREGVITVAKP